MHLRRNPSRSGVLSNLHVEEYQPPVSCVDGGSIPFRMFRAFIYAALDVCGVCVDGHVTASVVVARSILDVDVDVLPQRTRFMFEV